MSKQQRLFHAWLAGFDTDAQAYESIGLSKRMFYRIKGGQSVVSPDVALRIERQSGGSFRKDKLVWGDAA